MPMNKTLLLIAYLISSFPQPFKLSVWYRTQLLSMASLLLYVYKYNVFSSRHEGFGPHNARYLL